MLRCDSFPFCVHLSIKRQVQLAEHAPSKPLSGKDLRDHFAGDIGESVAAAVVEACESLDVEAEKVKDGGVEIVHAGQYKVNFLH